MTSKLSLCAVVSALCVGSALPRFPQTVRAEAFELVDADGSVRGRLALDAGVATLALQDAEGRTRLRMQAFGDGQSGLSLFAASGAPLVVVGAAGESAFVRLANKKGCEGVSLMTRDDGSSTLALQDQEGAPRLQLLADKDGNARIMVINDQQLVQTELSSDGEVGGLYMRAPSGEQKTEFTIDQRGRSNLLIREGSGRAGIGLGVGVAGDNDDGATLHFFDPKGMPRLQLGWSEDVGSFVAHRDATDGLRGNWQLGNNGEAALLTVDDGRVQSILGPGKLELYRSNGEEIARYDGR